MKLKTASLIALASAILLAGCRYTGPVTTTTTPAALTPTPSLNELNTELNATVDDGGAADLKQLQKEATGL